MGLTPALLLAAGLAATAAGGDLEDMHDFDQKRRNLPVGGISEKPGGSYCVPTSIMNELYFLHDRGFDVLPSWNSSNPANHDAVTSNIFTLGLVFGTGPNGGQGDLGDNLQNYLDLVNAPDPFFVVDVAYRFSTENEVTFPTIKAWLDFQGLVSFTLRNYDTSGAPFWVKKNSHHLTMVGLSRTSPGRFELRYRDPITGDSNLDVQSSPYQMESITLRNDLNIYDGVPATLLRQVGESPVGESKAVISFMAVRPMFLLSDFGDPAAAALDSGAEDASEGDTAPGAALTLTTPGNARLGGPETVRIPHAGRARDLAINPTQPRAMFLQTESNAVFEADLVSGEVRVFATLEAPRRLAYGGQRPSLFVLDGPRITVLGRDGRPQRTVHPGAPITALTFDPAHNRLVAVSAPQQRILYFDEDLRPAGQDPLPDVPGQARLHVTADAASQETWLHRNGSDTLVALSYDERGAIRSREVRLQNTAPPLGLAVDDRGLILTSERGVLHAYDLTGAPSHRTPLAGLPSGSVFAVPHRYSNHDVGRIGLIDTPAEPEDER
jgi:hypothetical protein